MVNIKKFEQNSNDEYSLRIENYFGVTNYPYGGHIFVLAKPKNGWSLLNNHFEDNEYVPCMISGKNDIWIIGSVNAYSINDFEIIKNSDKNIQEIINLYLDSDKYNL